MPRGLTVLATTLLLPLYVCARDVEPKPEDPAYQKVLRVIVQVCIPTLAVRFVEEQFDLTVVPPEQPTDTRTTGTARRRISPTADAALRQISSGQVLDRNSVLSSGSSLTYLHADTVRGQPVYERQSYRPQDVIALYVMRPAMVEGKESHVTYWYRLPKTVPSREFSAWQAPMTEETKEFEDRQARRTAFKLMHREAIDIRPVRPEAPKMRFRLVTIREYGDQQLPWYRTLKAIHAANGQSELYVPKATAPIPAC